MVVTCERYDSKLFVQCGILAARFVPLFIKKLLKFSAIAFLSVISLLPVIELLGKESFCALTFQKKSFIIFQQFLLLFSLFKIYFGRMTFLIAFLTFRINVYTSYMLLHFMSFFASRVFHEGAVSSMNIFWNP